MAFTLKKKKKLTGHQNPAPKDLTPKVETIVNEEGTVELKSKNFTITPSQKTDIPDSISGSDNRDAAATWQCWGCGSINTEPVCPVCGKKRAQ